MLHDLVSKSVVVEILRAKAMMAAGLDAGMVYDNAANMVEKLPTVYARPDRMGAWDDRRHCAACGKPCVEFISPKGERIYVETSYCPHCGCKNMTENGWIVYFDGQA